MRGGDTTLKFKITPNTVSAEKMSHLEGYDEDCIYPVPHICVIDGDSADVLLEPTEKSTGMMWAGCNNLESSVTKLHMHAHGKDSDGVDTGRAINRKTKKEIPGASGEGGDEAFPRIQEDQPELPNVPGTRNTLYKVLTGAVVPIPLRKFHFPNGGAPAPDRGPALWETTAPEIRSVPAEPNIVKNALEKVEAVTDETMCSAPTCFRNGILDKIPGICPLEVGKSTILGGVVITKEDNNTLLMNGDTDFFIPGHGVFSVEGFPTPIIETFNVTTAGNPMKVMRVTMHHCDGSQAHPYVEKSGKGYYDHKQFMSVYYSNIGEYNFNDSGVLM